MQTYLDTAPIKTIHKIEFEKLLESIPPHLRVSKNDGKNNLIWPVMGENVTIYYVG